MADMGRDAGPERVPAPAWQAWVETAGLTAGFLAVGAILDRQDPFFLRHGFPWLALAPLLAGLRYGSSHGMACGALQMAALGVAWRWGRMALPGSVAEIGLGWLMAGLIAGEFRNSWLRRGRRLEATVDHLRLRLEGLGRAHRALKVSHDRLQGGGPGRPASLRDALEAFRRELFDLPDGGSLASLGGRILTLFSQHAFVRAATLHQVDDGNLGPAIATLGGAAGSEEDPLAREAARLGEVVSVAEQGEWRGALAAVPLVDVEGRVHAVVAIRDLPFVALHAETLELLGVLGGHIGDIVTHALGPVWRGRARRKARWFFRSVSRSMKDARNHGVPASLVMVRVQTARSEPSAGRRLAVEIAAQRRLADDAVVLFDHEANPVVVLLLRLADASGLERYRDRLDALVRERAGQLSARGEISIRGWVLSESFLPKRPAETEASLMALVRDGAIPTTENEAEEVSWHCGTA